MRFRKDINGLRALAVVAVLLFHFDVPWMTGGFVGVDVFFVISGFLMTAIIFDGMRQGRFLLLNFYVARTNRIIPALAVLCGSLLLFGWFYLTPLDFAKLGKHVASSMLFVSNAVYWREAGYFDTASHGKWLLHTWSLSIEWQFYLLYPLVLVGLRRFFRLQTVKFLVLLGALLGFLFCVLTTFMDARASFFLLPSRAWELLLGGVAYLYPLKSVRLNRKPIEWAGLALIVLSCVWFSPQTLWPGYWALVPVFGTFLVLQAQQQDSFITGHPVAQKIGLWSYSIYLWHWPLVVAIGYFGLADGYRYLGLLIAFPLGYLSYRWVESFQFRRQFSGFLAYLRCKPLQFTLLLAMVGSAAMHSNGFEWHYPAPVLKAVKEAGNRNPHACVREKKFPCYLGNRNNIRAIIVGDSHADALTTSLANVFDLEEQGIIALNRLQCPFVLEMKSTRLGDRCLHENNRRLEFLQNNHVSVPVFWVARTSAYLLGQSNPDRIKDALDTQATVYFSKPYEHVTPELLRELEAALQQTVTAISASRNVYLVLPTPEMRKNVPQAMGKAMLLGEAGDDFSIPKSLYLVRNLLAFEMLEKTAQLERVKTLDPAPYLCDEKRCFAQQEGRPLFFDGDHLSEFGNKLLSPMFERALADQTSD